MKYEWGESFYLNQARSNRLGLIFASAPSRRTYFL
jgi:hypothetical protein